MDKLKAVLLRKFKYLMVSEFAIGGHGSAVRS